MRREKKTGKTKTVVLRVTLYKKVAGTTKLKCKVHIPLCLAYYFIFMLFADNYTGPMSPRPSIAGPSRHIQDSICSDGHPGPPPLSDVLGMLKRRRVSVGTGPPQKRAAADTSREPTMSSDPASPSSEQSHDTMHSEPPCRQSDDSAVTGSSTHIEPVTAPISPALRAFLGTLRTGPLDVLASIFSDNGFDSETSLDMLSELPPEDNWEEMKQEILTKGRLAGWLAVKGALQQRRSSIQGRRQDA